MTPCTPLKQQITINMHLHLIARQGGKITILSRQRFISEGENQVLLFRRRRRRRQHLLKFFVQVSFSKTKNLRPIRTNRYIIEWAYPPPSCSRISPICSSPVPLIFSDAENTGFPSLRLSSFLKRSRCYSNQTQNIYTYVIQREHITHSSVAECDLHFTVQCRFDNYSDAGS